MWHRMVGCALGLMCLASPALPQETAATAALLGRNSHGLTIELSRLRGKVVLVFLWSTDCPVCLDLLPELRRNLAGWRGRPFEIVAVSQDRKLAALKAYEQVLDRVRPPDPQMAIVWRGDPAHRDSFGKQPANAPTTLLFDRTGQLVKTVRGRWSPQLWDEIAELVLN